MDGPSNIWVATVRARGQIIAAALGYLEQNAVNLRVIAHDQNYAYYSPGRSLLLTLIEEAISRGYTKFYLGIGDLEWKERFGAKHSLLMSERISL
jgi:CelD/BcsL family acetyltransferase involved in cellulose biosynthesis